MFKPINCPKQDCGAPMKPKIHLGQRKMQCTKMKCLHLMAEYVSAYFHQKGEPCLVIYDVHRHPLHVSISHIELFCASFCVDRIHIYTRPQAP